MTQQRKKMPEIDPKKKSASQKENESKRREVAGASIAAVSAFFAAYVNFFEHNISLWVTFCCLVLFLIGIGISAYDHIKSSWLFSGIIIVLVVGFILSSSLQTKREDLDLQQTVQPKDSTAHSSKFSAGFSFNSNSDEVIVNLGGNEYGYVKSALTPQRNARPITLGGYIPFKLYLDNGKLFVDIDAWHESEVSTLRIVRNSVVEYPLGWDWNFNDNALEIVDTSKSPIVQVIYRSEDSVIIRGLFKSRNDAIFSTEKGLILLGGSYLQYQPKLKLQRIFKYPSWKYPNQLDEP